MKKNKKNIIICVEKKITKRDISRFGIKFLKKNFNVDIVNFTNLITGKKIIASNHEIIFKNFRELDTSIKTKKYICAIDYLRTSEEKKISKIKKLLKENHVKLVQIHNGLLPIESKFSKEKFFKIFNFKIILRYLLKLLKNFFSNEKIIHDISLISGLKAEEIYPETKHIKTKIFTHSFDYENTLNKNDILIKDKLAIFLDENLINHPDYKIFGLDISMYKYEYYTLIKQTLRDFEKAYNVKVIICIHPSQNIKQFRKNFKNFKCVSGKTEYYSRKASIVLAHQSTAISYPVIYKKPIIFLNYKKLRNNFLYANINRMAKLFNKNHYFIDQKIVFERINDFKVDKECYSKYLNNYICHPISKKNKSMWEMLVKKLNSK